ncbi:MAG: class I SAM-dependent methyltransferase [wastewater metagenome]|nr:class I SAM-dependent methyltransferase [Candidatus Loosdrechtia aerotolerans]
MLMDAEALAFQDQSFDTVISSLDVCTFMDPVAAIREMVRVCRIDGRILFLEHGRSAVKWLGRFQDRTANCYTKRTCCHWNRESLDLIHQAGLKIVSARRAFLGILHVIEAKHPQDI